MKLRWLCTLVTSVAIFFGGSIIRERVREMDQDVTVARYFDLKVQSRIDKSQELKDKLAGLVEEIKVRWQVTPDELIRDFYRRAGPRKDR